MFCFIDFYPITENIELAILSLIGKYTILIKIIFQEKTLIN
jgi:hypothetical protein